IFLAITLLLATHLLFGQATEATLLGNWQDTSLIGSNAHNNIYNDLWGYATNDHEYAIIGSTAGTHIIDVTDPQGPFEAYFVPGRSVGGQIIHRDYHEYKGFLYVVADEGGPSFQIIDLRKLPVSVHTVEHAGIGLAHNIFVDTAAARLYAMGRDLEIFNIEEPQNPVLIGRHAFIGNNEFRYFHDGYIDNNIAFFNTGNEGLVVADLTDPTNPSIINSLTLYPQRGYNHSGWVSTDAQTYYFADENHGSPLKAMDVNNFCDLEVGLTFDGGSTELSSIAHNLIVACDYLYVSYYYDGLRVYDISDQANPKLVSYYDTFAAPNDRRYKGAWGVYPFLPSGNILLSDMQTGLYVFEGMGDNCQTQNRESINLQNQNCNLTSTADIPIWSDLKMSPNPATEKTSLIVNFPQALDHLTISLIDVNGQIIQRQDYRQVLAGKNDFTILLPNSLAKGLYFLSLRSDSFHLTKKLVIGQ
ncbi:MAG: choice-of-anchor B family protein, partial [Bacteroidota bacterium]